MRSVLRTLETLHLLCQFFFVCVCFSYRRPINNQSLRRVTSNVLFFSESLSNTVNAVLKMSFGVKKNTRLNLFFFLEPYFLAWHVEILGILCRREGGASRKTYGESGARSL